MVCPAILRDRILCHPGGAKKNERDEKSHSAPPENCSLGCPSRRLTTALVQRPVEGTEALTPRILGLPLDPALSPLIGTITVRNES